MPISSSGWSVVCTAMMHALPETFGRRCLFFRNDGPADTITAGLPLYASFKRDRLGVATYHARFRVTFSAVRRPFSTSVEMFVFANDLNSSHQICICR